ncbi:MAG: branched-chain amino acid ABC transporter permease [Alphaproteobacteria bacterium]
MPDLTRLKTAGRKVPIWAYTTVLLLAATRMPDYYLYLANLTIINAIVAIGLVVLTGVAGQLSLGTAALVAIGSYGCGMALVHLGWPFPLAAIASMAATTLIGTALAGPALRLSGLHLAIVTLAFGMVVVQIIGLGGNVTGGMAGLTIPAADIFGFSLSTEWHRYIVSLIVFTGVIYSTHRLISLKPGRALLAIRERELAARALGVDPTRYKILAFAYSSFLCALAGVLYAPLKGYISVDDFTIWNSIYYFVMIALGGMTSVAGAIIGAIVVTIAPELLGGLLESSQLGFGILVLVIILFAPGGIIAVAKRAWRRLVPQAEAESKAGAS